MKQRRGKRRLARGQAQAVRLLTVDTIEEARRKLLGCVSRPGSRWGLRAEPVGLEQALGRVLAEDVAAPEDMPAFSRSAVDGYAVIAADTAGAGEAMPVLLRLAGAVEMGKPAGFALRRGECAYVPTGGMLPGGADAVAMLESAEAFGPAPASAAPPSAPTPNAPLAGAPPAGEIAVYESAAVGSHVIRAGEDLRRGDILLRRGARLRSHEIGALAAAGISAAPALLPLRISIISSGDELAPCRAQPAPGQIRDANAPALRALAMESGYRVAGARAVRDDEKALADAVREAMAQSDVVALSGGSSQGEKDLTAKVFSGLASPGVFTHGLALKPGKPAILAWDEKTETVLAGLPGHPVSALMAFRLLLSWLARRVAGQKEPLPVPAKIACSLPGSPGRACCQPVALRPCEGGYLAEPVYGKAGLIASLAGADGYIVIDRNREGLRKGEPVQVFLWDR